MREDAGKVHSDVDICNVVDGHFLHMRFEPSGSMKHLAMGKSCHWEAFE